MQQQQGGGDVGTVREPDRDRRCQAVGRSRRGHEAREVGGAAAQIVFVEHAFGQTAEEARHPVLADRAAGREQGRPWGQCTPQRQQVVFVTAGAVQ